MAEFSFAKHLRLLNAGDFSYVFDRADFKVSSKTILILARVSKEKRPTARLGLVISKKNARLAVQRNRIKRLARDSFRLKQHSLPAVDIVLLARHGLDQKDSSEISIELDKLWLQLVKQVNKGENRNGQK